MIVVIEPGVAIKWFVEEPLRPQARSLLVDGHELIAPDILIAGVAELVWKKAASGEIAPDQAAPIVRSIGLPSFISAFVEFDPAAQPRAGAGAAVWSAGARLLLRRLCRSGIGDAGQHRRGLPARVEDGRRRHPRRAAGARPRARRRIAMYAELQVTTNYSFLRSGSHPGELALQALKLGHTAIGIADRNTLAGVVRAYAAIEEYYEEFPAPREERFKLLVGARLETRDGYSLLAYPTDLEAYKRLSRLLTVGNRRAAKGECDLTFDDLASHAEGILAIVLPPRRPEEPAFRERLRALARLFGDRCYLAGTMLFRGDDARRLALLDNLAATTGIGLVATNDVHYHVPERRALHDVVTAIRLGCTVDELGFRRFASAERHLKEPTEMARLFRRHPHAIARTQEIVERCRFSLDQLTYQYPVMYEGGETPMDKLARLTWEGAAWRYPEGVPEKVARTIRHEFELIDRKQIAPYFLTVHEIVWQAREMKILCQGRGSAANSAVCYCLGITSVDPGKTDVLFERFLSNERNEPPDIDVDFEHERREDIIQWIYGEKGRHRAALAATVIAYRSRSAIREVGKALGLSPDTVGAMADTVWGMGSGGVDIDHVREAGLDPDRSAADAGAGAVGNPVRIPAPSFAACRRLRAHRRAARRTGAHPERGHGGPHRHRMGQGRSRRAQDLQGRRAGSRHADLPAQELRPDREALRRAAEPRHEGRGPERLRHVVQGRFHRRVPGRKPGADVDAAEAQAAQVLRPRRRGGDRAARPHPGRHGASLSEEPGGPRQGHLSQARTREHSEENPGRALVPGTGDADRHRCGRLQAGESRQAAPCHGDVSSGRHDPQAQERLHRRHDRQRLRARLRRAMLQADRGLRRVRLSRRVMPRALRSSSTTLRG